MGSGLRKQRRDALRLDQVQPEVNEPIGQPILGYYFMSFTDNVIPACDDLEEVLSSLGSHGSNVSGARTVRDLD